MVDSGSGSDTCKKRHQNRSNIINESMSCRNDSLSISWMIIIGIAYGEAMKVRFHVEVRARQEYFSNRPVQALALHGS